MRFPSLLVAFAASRHRASAFITTPRSMAASLAFGTRTGAGGGLAALPTVNDVSNDDFMKQLGHASQMIPAMMNKGMSADESATLLEMLSGQFSHSDGIRGFFAVYLTSPESLTVEEVPAVLSEAVKGADTKVMVPLACMNVIMPTAMLSIHQDPELKECAAKTANEGTKILRLLKGKDDVVGNCRAILDVCEGSGTGEGSKDLIEYWEKFFTNYKYEEQQKKDIALAISEFC